jgi:hypothetical protein
VFRTRRTKWRWIKQLKSSPALHLNRCSTTEYTETWHNNGNFDTDMQPRKHRTAAYSGVSTQRLSKRTVQLTKLAHFTEIYKVGKPNNSECHTPSSELFSIESTCFDGRSLIWTVFQTSVWRYLLAVCLALFFNPENVGRTILRNVGELRLQTVTP